MVGSLDWKKELNLVVNLMREFSKQTDPQEAALMYSAGLRNGLVPADEWLSVSRRGLSAPAYRITRSTTWKHTINPWKNPEKLPLYTEGLLGELIYSNEPEVITDLPSRLRKDDPAYEYLQGFELLASLPQYDDGLAINMGIMLVRDASKFAADRYPALVWQGNLYGRATHNMVLRNDLKIAYDRLDAELRSVGDIQRSLLPSELPKIDTLELAAFYETSRRAGGDYYDLFDLGGGRWGILIADVSGHSTPAAVVMAITHAVAHLHPGAGSPPGELLTFVNRHLTGRYTGTSGTFVTAFYGVYDATHRTLTYASAGHNPPRLLRRGITDVTSLNRVGGLPLGIECCEEYHEQEIALAPGDSILFYTDGITEARDEVGDMFGTSRLDDALGGSFNSAPELLDSVLRALRDFSGERSAGDDQTLLAAVIK